MLFLYPPGLIEENRLKIQYIYLVLRLMRTSEDSTLVGHPVANKDRTNI